MVISATGGVIRSLGGIGQSEGCVIDVEQPAISHAIAHSVMLLSESMSK